MDLHPAKSIKAEIFPAEVLFNGKDLGDQFKVFITDVALTIVEESPEGPSFYDEIIYDSVEGNRRTGFAVAEGGDVWAITKSNDCGCGSRLKGFNPYRGVARTAIY